MFQIGLRHFAWISVPTAFLFVTIPATTVNCEETDYCSVSDDVMDVILKLIVHGRPITQGGNHGETIPGDADG